jgi:hypothetical protein
MTTIEEIEKAAAELSADSASAIRAWFAESDYRAGRLQQL